MALAGVLALALTLVGLAALGTSGERGGVEPTKPGGWQEQQVTHLPALFTAVCMGGPPTRNAYVI